MKILKLLIPSICLAEKYPAIAEKKLKELLKTDIQFILTKETN